MAPFERKKREARNKWRTICFLFIPFMILPLGSILAQESHKMDDRMERYHKMMAGNFAQMQRILTGLIFKNVDKNQLIEGARGLLEEKDFMKEYLPHSHGADMNKYREMAEEFIGRVEELLRALEKGDRIEASSMYGRVLTTCTRCHQEFRR
jgi:soluble cytochrome b562